jgi:pimeloyl-ACP methyl ester carboxylesterase
MLPTVEALSREFRVITFPLCDERAAKRPFDRAKGLDNYVAQVEDALNAAGARAAVVCGVSFGGIVALQFAARQAERTRALILVSTPGPTWHLRPKHDIYARVPWLFGPIFFAEAPFRLGPELKAALPDRGSRWRFALRQLRIALGAPVSPARMAERARLISATDRAAACAAITAPTLIVHGEPSLDHVVRADGTAEYARLIRGAEVAMLERTGHQGAMTRPQEFAATVRRFVTSRSEHAA